MTNAKVLEVGNSRQLFIDDWIVEETESWASP